MKAPVKKVIEQKELVYGDLVFGEFPFEDGGGKNRWVFVLKDHGDKVTVVYCTSNPNVSGSVRLGALADGKVTNLVAHRWETVNKVRLAVGRTQRVPMPAPGVGTEILGRLKKMAELSLANPNAVGGFPFDVASELIAKYNERVGIAQAQFAKISKKKFANK